MSDDHAALYARVSTLMAEYPLRIDDHDGDGFAELFAPDGALALGPRTITGKEALADFARNASAGVHSGGPPVVTRDGDEVLARSKFLFVSPDGSRILAGTYNDRVVDDGVTARFLERAIDIGAASRQG